MHVSVCGRPLEDLQGFVSTSGSCWQSSGPFSKGLDGIEKGGHPTRLARIASEACFARFLRGAAPRKYHCCNSDSDLRPLGDGPEGFSHVACARRVHIMSWVKIQMKMPTSSHPATAPRFGFESVSSLSVREADLDLALHRSFSQHLPGDVRTLEQFRLIVTSHLAEDRKGTALSPLRQRFVLARCQAGLRRSPTFAGYGTGVAHCSARLHRLPRQLRFQAFQALEPET